MKNPHQDIIDILRFCNIHLQLHGKYSAALPPIERAIHLTDSLWITDALYAIKEMLEDVDTPIIDIIYVVVDLINQLRSK